MLKVLTIKSANFEYVEFENDTAVYKRYGPVSWTYLAGEDEITIYYDEELEDAYQQYKKSGDH